jgi:CheY-like chemotaxis protein
MGFIMSDVKRLNFDLPTLLRLGDLDIRRIAAEKASLTVKDFFGLLSKFIEISPQVTDSLNRMARLLADRNDFLALADMKVLLDELGYTKLIPVIDGIISAGEKGNMEFAADCAKRALNDFKRLCSRTETAIKTGAADDPANTQDSHDAVFSFMSYSRNYGVTAAGHPLREVLEQVDSAEATRKMRVLAVDDSPTMLKTIISTLKDQYKVFTLTNSTQVERFLQQITPELFLLDYKMPDLNGFELVPIIRSFEEHKDTPIIFLTSMGTKEHISAAAMLGACDFVVKPFDAYTLHDKIAKHIVRKKSF